MEYCPTVDVDVAALNRTSILLFDADPQVLSVSPCLHRLIEHTRWAKPRVAVLHFLSQTAAEPRFVVSAPLQACADRYCRFGTGARSPRTW